MENQELVHTDAQIKELIPTIEMVITNLSKQLQEELNGGEGSLKTSLKEFVATYGKIPFKELKEMYEHEKAIVDKIEERMRINKAILETLVRKISKKKDARLMRTTSHSEGKKRERHYIKWNEEIAAVLGGEQRLLAFDELVQTILKRKPQIKERVTKAILSKLKRHLYEGHFEALKRMNEGRKNNRSADFLLYQYNYKNYYGLADWFDTKNTDHVVPNAKYIKQFMYGDNNRVVNLVS
jgi:hypothetical protein